MNFKFEMRKDGPGFISFIKLNEIDLDYSKVPSTFRKDLEEGGWHGSLDLIADGSKKIKGYVRVTNAFVAKDLRQKGLATELYKRTLDWLKENGYKGIYSKSGQRVSDEAELLWKKIKIKEIDGYDVMETFEFKNNFKKTLEILQ